MPMSSSQTISSPIIVTSGEPAGIGPDIICQLSQQAFDYPWLCIGDPALFTERATQLGLDIQVNLVEPSASPASCQRTNQKQGVLNVIPLKTPNPVRAGELNATNASYVIAQLTEAARGCMEGDYAAVVTAPVHKGIINDAGFAFSGHTEFFADYAGCDKVVMMLANTKLRVALVTTHLPLRQVADAITTNELERTIDILLNDLHSQFGIASPKVLVCGLNPHAGEDGHLGHEEIEIITPVLDRFRQQGHNLIGPLPADTLYAPHNLKDADATLAMYHDQGLPVLKSHGFGDSINITLGLPFIRASVDHGTATDLAGSGKASHSSLRTAMQHTIDMLNNQS